jgi:glycogen(starch) synthase
MEVESEEPEPGSAFALTLQAMRDRGVKLIYGRWLIEGAPRVLLFDTGSCYDRCVGLSGLALIPPISLT